MDVVIDEVVDLLKAIGQLHIPRRRISFECLQQLQQREN